MALHPKSNIHVVLSLGSDAQILAKSHTAAERCQSYDSPGLGCSGAKGSQRLVLLQVADHFNAEVVAGTIRSKQDAIDYLTWTFFYRRVLQNPSYYDLEDTEMESVSAFLSDMVERNMSLLAVCSLPETRDPDVPMLHAQLLKPMVAENYVAENLQVMVA